MKKCAYTGNLQVSEAMTPEPGGLPMIARGEERTPGKTPLPSRLEPGGRPMIAWGEERTPGKTPSPLTSRARRAVSSFARARSPHPPADIWSNVSDDNHGAFDRHATRGHRDGERQREDRDRNRMMKTRRRVNGQPRPEALRQNVWSPAFQSAALQAPDVRGGGRLTRGSRTHPALSWDALRAEEEKEANRRVGGRPQNKAAARDATGVSIVRIERRFCNFAGCQQLAHGAPVSGMPFCG